MAAILGISAFYHDSAAALVVNGRVVAAAQEERFTRIKHDPAFPARAIDACLREAGLSPDELDYVAFYDKPLTKFERLLETYLAYAPAGFRSFRLAMPLWLKDKLHMRRTLRHGLGGSTRARLVFTDHHESHAASAFFPSPFDRAAILTLDGVGEWTTAAFGVGEGNRIRLIDHVEFPHSLGLLYSAFTYYCGFKVNSGEYKLMGLAPYGRPIYRDLILERLVELKPDGSFWLDMDYFRYCQGLTMTNDRFHRLFGGPPRAPESPLEQRHMDLAASIQAVTEEAVLRIGRHIHRRTGMKHLVLAGGVALNCVANGRLLREGDFEDLWIQPAAGDAGGAWARRCSSGTNCWTGPGGPRAATPSRGASWAPASPPTRSSGPWPARAAPAAGSTTRPSCSTTSPGSWPRARSSAGSRAGWSSAPGPWAARSILGDPRSPAMQATMNVKIKFRESFRPFAPIVLRERAAEWFDLDPGHESPYMLLVAPVLEHRRVPVNAEALRVMEHDPDLRRRVNVVRSEIPAVTHVDYSARLQTVDEPRNPRLYRLLEAFDRLTGCPVLVNTSFNVRGEPIVCTPEDAYRCFLATDMDALVLEDVVVAKDAATREAGLGAREAYLAQFQLD